MVAIQALPSTLPSQLRQLRRRRATQPGRTTTNERAALVRLVGEAKYLLRIKQKLRKKMAWRIRLAAIKQNQSTQPEDAPLQQPEVSTFGSKKPAIESKDVAGLKYLNLVAPLLKRLHLDGCARDTAGNRRMHFDQYCILILLCLFYPAISSLRAVDQASTLDKVKKQLGCSRATASSMSAATGVFDADRLKAIIAELGAETQRIGRHKSLKDIDQTITLVDGSLVSAMPSILAASFFKQDNSIEIQRNLHWTQ